MGFDRFFKKSNVDIKKLENMNNSKKEKINNSPQEITFNKQGTDLEIELAVAEEIIIKLRSENNKLRERLKETKHLNTFYDLSLNKYVIPPVAITSFEEVASEDDYLF